MRAREVCRRIERHGGVLVRSTGSHRTYVLPYGGGRLMTRVSVHPGDIPTGTLHQIQRDLAPALGRGWLIP
ncbi:MAG TPA: type II toxin-antitoxin system HicA family toxin [Frankiaceae bacterium]|jgi:predicted RNA binding protein YcfA (HicA-like mRNA interferase family)|nr:type II toxin-antitoxin system HicA family toxin [Frankiaceae bacterium]